MSIVLEKMQKADLAVQPGNVKLTTFKMNLVGFVVGKGTLVTMPIVHDSPTMNVRDECGRTMVAVIVTLKGINVVLTRRLPKTAYQSENRRGQIY